MSHKMFALFIVLGERFLCLLLQNIGVVLLNTVPVFDCSLMQVIDGGEVKVFLVPAEHRFP
jgi:hypothetical protein